MGQNEDAPSTRTSDKAYTKWLEGVARGVISIENYNIAIQEEKPTLTEFRVKCDPDDEEGVLVVLKGYVGQQEFVSFHRDTTVTAALTSVGNRLRNGSLNWREERPYGT